MIAPSLLQSQAGGSPGLRRLIAMWQAGQGNKGTPALLQQGSGGAQTSAARTSAELPPPDIPPAGTPAPTLAPPPPTPPPDISSDFWGGISPSAGLKFGQGAPPGAIVNTGGGGGTGGSGGGGNFISPAGSGYYFDSTTGNWVNSASGFPRAQSVDPNADPYGLSGGSTTLMGGPANPAAAGFYEYSHGAGGFPKWAGSYQQL